MSVKDININITMDENTKDLILGITVIVAIVVVAVVVLIL